MSLDMEDLTKLVEALAESMKPRLQEVEAATEVRFQALAMAIREEVAGSLDELRRAHEKSLEELRMCMPALAEPVAPVDVDAIVEARAVVLEARFEDIEQKLMGASLVGADKFTKFAEEFEVKLTGHEAAFKEILNIRIEGAQQTFTQTIDEQIGKLQASITVLDGDMEQRFAVVDESVGALKETTASLDKELSKTILDVAEETKARKDDVDSLVAARQVVEERLDTVERVQATFWTAAEGKEAVQQAVAAIPAPPAPPEPFRLFESDGAFTKDGADFVEALMDRRVGPHVEGHLTLIRESVAAVDARVADAASTIERVRAESVETVASAFAEIQRVDKDTNNVSDAVLALRKDVERHDAENAKCIGDARGIAETAKNTAERALSESEKGYQALRNDLLRVSPELQEVQARWKIEFEAAVTSLRESIGANDKNVTELLYGLKDVLKGYEDEVNGKFAEAGASTAELVKQAEQAVRAYADEALHRVNATFDLLSKEFEAARELNLSVQHNADERLTAVEGAAATVTELLEKACEEAKAAEAELLALLTRAKEAAVTVEQLEHALVVERSTSSEELAGLQRKVDEFVNALGEKTTAVQVQLDAALIGVRQFIADEINGQNAALERHVSEVSTNFAKVADLEEVRAVAQQTAAALPGLQADAVSAACDQAATLARQFVADALPAAVTDAVAAAAPDMIRGLAPELVDQRIVDRFEQLNLTEVVAEQVGAAQIRLDLELRKTLLDELGARCAYGIEEIRTQTSKTIDDLLEPTVKRNVTECVNVASEGVRKVLRTELEESVLEKVLPVVHEQSRSAAEELHAPIKATLAENIQSAVDEMSRRFVPDVEQRLMVNLVSKLREEVDRLPKPKDGKDGGVMRVAPPVPYEHGRVFEYGTWVAHKSGLWVAARTTDQEPEVGSPYWDCVAPGISKMEPCLEPDGRTISMYVQLADGTESKYQVVMPVPVHRGVYNAETTYSQHDIVQHDGSWWEAQKSGVLPAPGTSPTWRMQIKKGKDGMAGKDKAPASWKYHGEWQMDTDYVPGDIVRHAGVHWLNLQKSRERPPFHSLVSNDTWLKMGS